MQEIKTTLAELDADIATAKSIGAWSINKEAVGEKVTAWISTMLGVESKLPAIRAYIEKLERELLATQNALMERNNELIGARQVAEAGRMLAEAVEKIDAMIGLPPMYEPREMGAFKNGWNTNDEKWSKQRDAALSAYHSATRDITSKEKEV